MIRIYTPLTQVDTKTPTYKVGSRTEIVGGNEYIYLPGTTTLGQYDWVTIITSSALSYGSVTRLPAAGTSGVGLVGISQGTPAMTGNTFGWFQIKGIGWGNAGSAVASGSPVFSSGTAGLVQTLYRGTSAILNAFGFGTGVSGGTAKFIINYPFACGQDMT